MKHKQLPIELIEQVLQKLPLHQLSDCLRVSKSWKTAGQRLAYRNVKFNSVRQRERFFKCLQDMQDRSGERPRSLSPRKPSPTSQGPPPILIRRRASIRVNGPSEIARSIQSLDFGLQPRHLKADEPDLPMTIKAPTLRSISTQVLATRSNTTSPLIDDVMLASPRSAMSVDSPARMTLRTPTKTVFKSVAGTAAFVSSHVSPTRKRIGAGILSISTSSTNSSQHADAPVLSPYGSWSHRFVSPLVPVLGSLIPNLKQLSLCGCHVTTSDFGLMLELTKLERLDISYSTLKTDGVELIGRHCRHALINLNVSGIFKLGRNRKSAIYQIALHCRGLTKVVALDCPEMYKEWIDECLEISDGRIEFETSFLKSEC